MNEEISQLLKDLKNNVIPLDAQTQKELAIIVSEAYGGADVAINGKIVVNGSTGLPVSDQGIVFPKMPGITTIGQAESALTNSLIPMVVTTALAEQTSIIGAGDIVSIGDLVIQNALRGTQQDPTTGLLSRGPQYNPERGSFLPFIANKIGQTVKKVKESDAYHGNLSAAEQAESAAAYFNANQGQSEFVDPDIDPRLVDNQPEHGASGFSVVGPTSNPLNKSINWKTSAMDWAQNPGSGATVPVDIYLPAGQRIVSENGINQNIVAGFVNTPGYIQGTLTPDEMKLYLQNRRKRSPEWKHGRSVVDDAIKGFTENLKPMNVGGNAIGANLQEFDAQLGDINGRPALDADGTPLVFKTAMTGGLSGQTQSIMDEFSVEGANVRRRAETQWLNDNPGKTIPAGFGRTIYEKYLTLGRTATEVFIKEHPEFGKQETNLSQATDAEKQFDSITDVLNPTSTVTDRGAGGFGIGANGALEVGYVGKLNTQKENVNKWLLAHPTSSAVDAYKTLGYSKKDWQKWTDEDRWGPQSDISAPEGVIIRVNRKANGSAIISTSGEIIAGRGEPEDPAFGTKEWNDFVNSDPRFQKQRAYAREVSSGGRVLPNFDERFVPRPIQISSAGGIVPEAPPFQEGTFAKLIEDAHLTVEQKQAVAQEFHEKTAKTIADLKAKYAPTEAAIVSVTEQPVALLPAIAASSIVSVVGNYNVGQVMNAEYKEKLDAAVTVLESFPEYIEKHLAKGKSNEDAFNEWKTGLSSEDRARFEKAHNFLRDDLKRVQAVKQANGLLVGENSGFGQLYTKYGKNKFEQAAVDGTVREINEPPVDDAYWASLGANDPTSSAANTRARAERLVAQNTPSPSVLPPTQRWGSLLDPTGGPRDEWGDYRDWRAGSPDRVAAESRQNFSPAAERYQNTSQRIISDMSNRARGEYAADAAAVNAGALNSFENKLGVKTVDEAGNVSYTKNRATTVSAEEVKRAEGWAKSASLAANDIANDTSLSPKETVANVINKVKGSIQKFADEYEKEAGPQTAQAAKQVANLISDQATNVLAEKFGISGKPYDLNTYSVKVNSVAGLTSALSDPNNQALRDRFTAKNGDISPETIARVSRGNQEVLDDGAGGSWNMGQYRGTYGSGGAGGSGGGDEKLKSIRQTDFGRVMMAAFVGSQAWTMTGGAVMKELDAFTKTETAAATVQAYSGGDVTLAAARGLMKEEATYRAGQLAYEKFAPFTDALARISGTPTGDAVTNFGQSALMGIGAGAIVGTTAYALGALGGLGGGLSAMGAAGLASMGAAAPIGIGVAAAVGLPLIGMDIANTVNGKTPAEGYSYGNIFRQADVNSYIQDKWMADNAGAMPSGARPGYINAQGSDIDAFFNSGVTTAEEVALSKNPNLTPGELKKAAEILRGGSPQARATNSLIDRIVSEQGDVFGRPDISKGVAAAQHFLGSVTNSQNADTVSRMYESTVVAGTTFDAQLTPLGQMASYKGIYSGTPEASALGASFSQLSPVQQEAAVARQAIDYSNYAQLNAYTGSTAVSEATYQGMKYKTPEGMQAMRSAYSGANVAGEDLGDVVAYGAADIGIRGQVSYPAVTRRDALTAAASGLAPGQGNVVASAANLAQQSGAMGYTEAYQTFSGKIADGTFTAPQLQRLLEGNKYAMSDLSREGGLGATMPQLVDAQGRQAGVTDMSGIFAFANGQGLTGGYSGGAAALDAMGVYRGDTQMQSAILSGGTRAMTAMHQERSFGYQMGGIGVQFAQIASQEAYLWGAGGTSVNPTPGSMYGLQDTQRNIQWQSQLSGFEYSTARADLGNQYGNTNAAAQYAQWQSNVGFNREAAGFGQQTNLMQRANTRDQWQFQSQMSSLQFGWNMEDIDEGLRTATGKERKTLLTQRDRMSLSQNLETSNEDKQRKDQEQLWKREDERFAKDLAQTEKAIKSDEEAYRRETEQRATLFKMDREDLTRRIEESKQLHDINEQMISLQRKNQEDQIAFQRQSLGIQAAAAVEANKFYTAQTNINNVFGDMSTFAEAIKNSAPGMLKLMAALANWQVGIHLNVEANGQKVKTIDIDLHTIE